VAEENTFAIRLVVEAADWKHYNHNPDLELVILPRGSIANM